MSRKKIRRSKGSSRARSQAAGSGSTARILACDDCGCGLVSFAIPVADMRMDEFMLYMDAHHLMPVDYDYDPETCGGLVGESIVALTDLRLDSTMRLRAITILGHSPCVEALTALEELAASDDPLAGVAQLAYAECQGMIEVFGLSASSAATVH